jgi:hypothetical protein
MNRESRVRIRGLVQLTRTVVFIACLAVAGCDEDPAQAPVDPCVEQACNVEAVATQLADAYQNRDYAHFARLLHDDFRFILYPDFNPDPNLPPPPAEWGKTEEQLIHQRMFAPTSIPTEDPPVPKELWLSGVSINLAPSHAWAERTEYYQPANPNGVDPARWKAWGAEYSTSVLFETLGETDFQVTGTAWLVVLQDLAQPANAPGAFRLYRWQDLGGGGNRIVGVQQTTWSQIKQLYKPPVDPCVVQPCNVEAVVTQLAASYRNRDYAHFSRLVHDGFLFVLHPDPYLPPIPQDWSKAQELRIHQRMFAPTSIPTGDPPVPQGLWLNAVDINLARAHPWTERTEYYQPANPNGLDPARWKAWGAEYHSSVLFETNGETDYQVTGRAWFVVLQDLSKPANARGAFSLYRWQDLGGVGNQTAGVEARTWTSVKSLYGMPVDPCLEQPCTAEAVAWQLARSYQTRDYARFARLLHDDFLFILHPDPFPDPNIPTDWDRTEELRIHWRMFEPTNIPPNERPLPEELWLTSVNIVIQPAEPLVEVSEYYQGPGNPTGLDRLRW